MLAFYCITEPLPSSAQARSTTNQPRTFGGRAAAPAPAQKKDAATPPTAPDPEPAPNGGLPTDYKPPPAPPEMMTLEAPLLTEAQMENWKKIKSRYSSMVRGSSDLTSAADKQLLEEGLKYRLYIMTLKDQLDKRELHDRRLELTSTDLQTAGKLLKPQDVRKFRQTICEAIVRLTEPLLKNNFYVRLQAVTLLGELDLIVEDTPRNLKHEAYTPACEPLVTVLLDPEQPEAVKIAAARSIIRLMRYSQAPAELRQKVASAAISEFNRPGTHFWYQMRLAEVLSTIDSPVDLSTRKPFIVTALQNALRDPKRDVRVRAEAARSLGRVPLDPSVDISSVMRDIMALAQQMAAAQQQSPNQPIWKQVFFDLYLAFKQVDSNDRTPDKKSEGGLLNNPAASTLAKQTYPIIVPMVNDVLNDRQIKAPDVQKLQEWLAQNAPKAPPGAGTSEARPASTSSTTGVK
ncbi:hypothetical protein GC163_07465 [bacterium]|nr:hypothetical protein [bacterium]